MKILRLEILNLASLDNPSGEVIDFTKGALADTAIFSIVGPTGSGKSTILDAICLALYNRAPRYPRRKGERNQMIEIYGQPDAGDNIRIAPTDSRNILTRGKKDGYSKLTFLANDGCIYRAEWSVHFSYKKYAPVVTTLVKLETTPETVVETVMEWDAIPAIIGLDYDQFLRTVLIAQGSFASFLTARENERYELLEKLVGCEDTYNRIADEIKLRKDEASVREKEIKAHIDAYNDDILSDEEINELNYNKFLFSAQLNTIRRQADDIDAQIKWYDTFDTINADYLKAKAAERRALDEVELMKPSASRLALHDAIAPALTMAAEVRRLDGTITQHQNDIGYHSQTVERKTNDLESLNAQKAEQADLLKCALQAIDLAAPHIRQARLLFAKIETAASALKDKDIAVDAAQKESDAAQKALATNADDIAKAKDAKAKADDNLLKIKADIESERSSFDSKLKQNDDDLALEYAKIEHTDADSLVANNTLAAQRLADLNRAIGYNDNIAKWSHLFRTNTSRRDTLIEDNGKIKVQLQSFSIDALALEVDALNTSYTLLTSENWALHRSLLRPDAPCPLCGGTHHPYATDRQSVADASSSLLALLNEKKALLDKQKKAEQSLNKTLSKNEGEIDTLKRSIDADAVNIEQEKSKLAALMSKYPEWSETTDPLASLLDDYNASQASAQMALNEYNAVQKRISGLNERRSNDMKSKSEFETGATVRIEAARQSADDSAKVLVGYQSQTENLANQCAARNEALQRLGAEQKKAKAEVDELKTLYNNELSGKNPDDEEARLVKAREGAEKKIADVLEKITKVSAELSSAKAVVETHAKQSDADQAVRRERIAQLDAWISTFNATAAAPLSCFDIYAMLEATDDWERIRTDKTTKEQALAAATALRLAAESRLTQHSERKPAMSLDDLMQEARRLATTDISARLHAVEQRLERHCRAVQLTCGMAQAMADASACAADWRAIADACGSDGRTLRKIAQCYTLRFLVEHANAEIRKFNSRYELIHVRNSLGLRIIDHDRADDIRETTSLSGGETFVVSLGLALGLASLSSRNISFDNLFIDEGFGSLDPSTLAAVIDSLAMLQTSQGKKVGVISHTDIMSERITTQIRIVKNGNSGSSHIEIYP